MGSKLAIDVTAQTTQASQNIQNISDKITELANRKNSIVGVSTSIAAIGVAANTVKGIMQDVLNVSKEWVSLYEKQVLSEKRLDVILKNVGTDAQMTSKSLKDYASSLQLVTRYGDETVISVEQILLETGKLNKDGLERATELSLDLAEAMGTDATSAAQTLALALQDPEAGLIRLRKAHVTFSEAEEQTIKNLVAEGRELEAQERILDKVADTYGGLAREIGSVDVSTLEKISNVWGDIKEDLGQGLLDAINPALETLYGWLVKIEKWINHASDLQKATNAALRGESLEGFDEELLNEAAEELRKRQVVPTSIGTDEFMTNMQMYQPTKTAEDIAIEAIVAELEGRVVAAEEAAAQAAAAVSGNADRGWDIKLYKSQFNYEDVSGRAALSVPVNIIPEGSVEILEDQGVAEKISDWVDNVWDKQINYVVSSAAKAINSISGLINQLYDNEISALDRQLSEMEEKWDKYFQNLDKKYKKDKQNLDAMYESGQMSAEEYESELAKMDAARVKSEEDKDDELKKLQAKKQELERKQFEASKANQIAQATIAGAQSIAGIWASSGAYGVAGPAIAAALTAISAAAVGAQIATIASQQYVPALAEGGIVSKPTLALIGEAGPEAVVPLSKGYGGMTVVVQVENVYTSDDLSAAVYEGIRKLQGTGALPKWS